MNKQGTILIVDDNKGVLTAVQLLLKNYFTKVITLASPVTLPAVLREEAPEVVLLDMNFTSGINNGNEGLFWLHEIKKLRPALPVVLFTAYADIDLAVRGIKEGATDFIVKPWDNQKLVETLQTAVTHTKSGKKKSTNEEKTSGSSMYWGASNAMQQLRQLIEKVAITDANILITGENGTGKEMLAKEIHALSSRKQAEMVAVDMGAITESLFESELFGHVKGSFTDAHADRIGKFEAANRSTLFLDEIGNLPYHLQAKLLTAIQRRSIVRVGSNEPLPINIRLICATNRNLQEMVDRSEFREDLLYRINTIHVEIPPLRERKEDIVPLAERFITRFCKQYDKAPINLSPSAKEKLTAHPWYGNIRELEHAIEKAVIINDGTLIPAELFQLPRRTEMPDTAASTLEEMEMRMIQKALEKCNGNLSAVATQLGITRQTLYNKMKKFGL
jgi:two-component system response regulator